MNLMIGFSNFILWGVIMSNGQMVWKYLYRALYQTYMIGLLPIFIVVNLYNSYLLKNKIKFTNQINADLSKYQSEIRSKCDISLTSINLREVLTVDSNSLLYMGSADNYVEIHWLESGLESVDAKWRRARQRLLSEGCKSRCRKGQCPPH